MSDSIEQVIADMLAVRAPDFGSPSAREAIYSWATRLDSLRQVPEGWVLVPREPTSDMVEALSNVGYRHGYKAAYVAMLDKANPAPPTSGDRMAAIIEHGMSGIDYTPEPTPAQALGEVARQDSRVEADDNEN